MAVHDAASAAGADAGRESRPPAGATACGRARAGATGSSASGAASGCSRLGPGAAFDRRCREDAESCARGTPANVFTIGGHQFTAGGRQSLLAGSGSCAALGRDRAGEAAAC